MTAPVLRFAPDRRLTVVSGLAAAAVAIAAAVSSDPAGRLLLVIAALLLAAYAVTDLIFSPRITASADGLILNAPFARTRLSWGEVEAVRADARQRLGIRAVSLEIDAGATIAVFSRRALGTDPERAAELLHAVDPRT